MNKKLPIYTLVIKEDNEDSGVDFVALVDQPAIERNWFAFKEEKPFTFQADEERKIITGALMIADLPIYRRDNELGEYYVVFDKSQIETMVQKFMRKGFQNNVNEMHDHNKKVEGVSMFESFIVDSQRGISAPRGFEGVPEGSWFGSYKVDNEEVWNKVKQGEFMGFSVEGMFKPVPQEKTLESEILDIIKEIQK
jgi:hypothetical protein